MTTDQSTVREESLDRARELIAEAGRIRAWLERLESKAGERPEHIIARVRGDYEARLADVVDKLGGHRAAVADGLSDAEDRLRTAEAGLSEAEDAREEISLRFAIGELEEARWEECRPDLDRAVEEAGRERSDTAAEVAGLREVLDELDVSGDQEPAPRHDSVRGVGGPEEEAESEWVSSFPTAADGEEELAGEASEALPQPAVNGRSPAGERVDIPRPDDSGATDDGAPVAKPATREGGADGLEFLEELDRAIASSAESSSVAAPVQAASGIRPASAEGSLPCRECAAVNDSRAWYCEVCGTELS